MTREEAIEQIKWYFEEDDGISAEDITKEAVDMAIEALLVETKGDLISRQWLLDLYATPKDRNDVEWKVPLEVVRQNILDAPSAEAVPLSVVDKISEECERLEDRVAELEEQLADTVSREDYHNLLMASNDIDRALREYQAKEEQLSAEAASREPLDIFARMYRAERESARSSGAEAVSADRPHGEWIEKNSHTYICDHCGFEQAIYGNLDEYNYCPNCGAKMKAR